MTWNRNVRQAAATLASISMMLGACQKEIAPGVSERRAQAIEEALKKSLIDPESLQVDWWPYYGKGTYCGLFNARNRMGGYVGRKLFAALRFESDVVVAFSFDDDDKIHANVVKYCRDAGYEIELRVAGVLR